jgi:hypothetical protein
LPPVGVDPFNIEGSPELLKEELPELEIVLFATGASSTVTTNALLGDHGPLDVAMANIILSPFRSVEPVSELPAAAVTEAVYCLVIMLWPVGKSDGVILFCPEMAVQPHEAELAGCLCRLKLKVIKLGFFATVTE